MGKLMTENAGYKLKIHQYKQQNNEINDKFILKSQENNKLKSQINELKQNWIKDNLNLSNQIDHLKKESALNIEQNDKWKQENKELKDKINTLTKNVNVVQLNEFKSTMPICTNNIKETEKQLIDNTYKCMECRVYKADIAFIDGCDHFALCRQCEKETEVKMCPICELFNCK